MVPPVFADLTLKLLPGDFNARIAPDGSLHVPPELIDRLRAYHIRIPDAIYLFSYVESFPAAVALALGWTVEDVSRAKAKLVAVLRGHMPEDVLNPRPASGFGMGALPPKLPKK